MRVLPRVYVPKPKTVRRLWRHSKHHLSVRRVYYFAEAALFLGVYLVIFSGSRLRFIDAYGRRTDLVVSLLLVTAFVLFHIFARRLLLPILRFARCLSLRARPL